MPSHKQKMSLKQTQVTLLLTEVVQRVEEKKGNQAPGHRKANKATERAAAGALRKLNARQAQEPDLLVRPSLHAVTSPPQGRRHLLRK